MTHITRATLPCNGTGNDPNDFRDNPAFLSQLNPAIDEGHKRKRFRLIHAGSITPKPPQWLIRDLLETDSLSLVFGDPGCGKSFLAVDLACCIATGKEFHGKKVKQAPVIYIAGEGHNGIGRRLNAWSIRHGLTLTDAPLYISKGAAALLEPSESVNVIDAVDAIAEKSGEPGLIVIDTVARNFGPGDENSTRDMGLFVHAADEIRERYKCAVLLIHHTGHGDKTRARGAIALTASTDVMYRAEQDEDGIVRLENVRMKDGPTPEPMAFELRTVELPLPDEDGQPVTSAVLHHTDYQLPPKRGQARGKWQPIALEALQQLQDIHRQNVEDRGGNIETARVSLEAWRDACQEAGIPRQRWYEAKESLIKKGEVELNHGFVSCPDLSGVRVSCPSGS